MLRSDAGRPSAPRAGGASASPSPSPSPSPSKSAPGRCRTACASDAAAPSSERPGSSVSSAASSIGASRRCRSPCDEAPASFAPAHAPLRGDAGRRCAPRSPRRKLITSRSSACIPLARSHAGDSGRYRASTATTGSCSANTVSRSSLHAGIAGPAAAAMRAARASIASAMPATDATITHQPTHMVEPQRARQLGTSWKTSTTIRYSGTRWKPIEKPETA